MLLLDPGASDPDAGQRQVGIIGDIRLGGRRHVADEMRKLRAVRIHARGADIDQDTRQVGGVDLDRRHIVPGEELAHHDRDEAAMAAHLALDAATLVFGERHDAGEVVERRSHVAGLLGDQQSAPVQPVAGDHGAEPIQHAPARRRDQPCADPVLLGERGIAAALHHLHLVQPRRQRAEQRHLRRPSSAGRGG